MGDVLIRRVLLVALIALHPFIALVIGVDVGPLHIDPPLGDVAGALLLLACIPLLVRGDRAPLPGPVGATLFLTVAILSAVLMAPAGGSSIADALWWTLRKPTFSYIAYGIALAAVVRKEARVADSALVVMLWLVAALSIATSIQRIAAGAGLWWAGIEGLTPNHKTLALWLSLFTPVLVAKRSHALNAVIAVALVLSASKTAWLVAGFGLAWSLRHNGRPLIARWRVAGLVGTVATGLLLASPWLLGSAPSADAFRSRRSLDLRAWTMFTESPLIGRGPGTSITFEMVEYPHYRINHVEAHGVIQKVGSELGVAGMVAWGTFAVGLGAVAARRREDRWTWLGVLAASHVALLSSTEAFTMTHWVPVGLAWGHVFRERD